MSRIYEAMQRAAETTSSETPTEGEAAASSPADNGSIEALSREPFPIELESAARARRRPIDVSAAASPTDTNEPEKEPVSDRRSSTIFERLDSHLAEKVVVDENISAVSREQYRRLAAVLHDAQANTGIKVIMIASGVPGEGKTLTATNIALTLSDSYRRRVLLIDADLRKPTLHHLFRLNTTSGLIDGLESEGEARIVLRQVSPHLSVLPAGRPTSDPMAALTSQRMRDLIDEARENFDWVIIDTPPLMLLTDAHLLSAIMDKAVLVVKADSTPYDLVRRTAEIIGRDRIAGVVLNHAHVELKSNYDSYYGDSYLSRRG